MKRLIEHFVDKSLLVNVLTIMIFILGTVSLYGLQKEIFQKVEFDVITVRTVYPGATPEDVEKLITISIERQLKGVDGVRYLHGVSQENFSLVYLELESGEDIVLDEDTSYRIGLVMGIAPRFHAVKVKDTAIYIRESNTYFSNRTGLEVMLSSTNKLSLYYRWVDSFWN